MWDWLVATPERWIWQRRTMHNLRIQNELQRAVTDLRASGFWDFFLIFFFKYSVKEQGRIGNHAWITKQKKKCTLYAHKNSCSRINEFGRILHSTYWMVFAQLIEFEVYELKRSHVNYNPWFTWQLRRKIHFLFFFFFLFTLTNFCERRLIMSLCISATGSDCR